MRRASRTIPWRSVRREAWSCSSPLTKMSMTTLRLRPALIQRKPSKPAEGSQANSCRRDAVSSKVLIRARFEPRNCVTSVTRADLDESGAYSWRLSPIDAEILLEAPLPPTQACPEPEAKELGAWTAHLSTVARAHC